MGSGKGEFGRTYRPAPAENVTQWTGPVGWRVSGVAVMGADFIWRVGILPPWPVSLVTRRSGKIITLLMEKWVCRRKTGLEVGRWDQPSEGARFLQGRQL
jgi:hypothetical protein